MRFFTPFDSRLPPASALGGPAQRLFELDFEAAVVVQPVEVYLPLAELSRLRRETRQHVGLARGDGAVCHLDGALENRRYIAWCWYSNSPD